MPPRSPLDDLYVVYVRLRPEDISYVKFIFESYETVGFLRTVDPREATLAVFVVPDFRDVGEAVLESIAREIDLERIRQPDDVGDDWLVQEIFED
jgi:hypothetical protein